MKQALKTSQKASQRALFLRERLCFTPKKSEKPSKTPLAVDYRGIFRQKKYAVKEPDPETGLYYYGSRYLDPKTSRWISGDPALGEYLPVAPLGEEERKRNQSLPGQGGVFNYVNLHVYHYAGNNPVKYVDPDGMSDEISHAETDKIFADWQKTCDPKYYKVSHDVKTYIEDEATAGNLPTSEQITQVAEQALMGRAIYEFVGSFALSVPRKLTNIAVNAAKGKLGEMIVRSKYEIGKSKGFLVNNRIRIADGINDNLKTISEVKNVKGQGLTKQLNDYIKYAEDKGYRFDLYINKNAVLSPQLRAAINSGRINLITY